MIVIVSSTNACSMYEKMHTPSKLISSESLKAFCSPRSSVIDASTCDDMIDDSSRPKPIVGDSFTVGHFISEHADVENEYGHALYFAMDGDELASINEWSGYAYEGMKRKSIGDSTTLEDRKIIWMQIVW